MSYFYPRSPCGERPVRQRRYRYTNFNFYPRSPCGERHYLMTLKCLKACHFYPRSPCGERRRILCSRALCRLFLSTLSLRRATQWALNRHGNRVISIHALLAESDAIRLRSTLQNSDFYPRSPCGERLCKAFSTFSASNFYPRSPCGERQNDCVGYCIHAPISIHALLAESDLFLRSGPMTHQYFYPRSPCGERPAHFARQIHSVGISIHALLAESDQIPHRGQIP